METLDAIDEFRSSCGKAAWQALPHIRKLLVACRKSKVPVIYSTSDPEFKAVFGNATKRAKEPTTSSDKAVEFPQMIRPRKDEYVVRKARASAFFGTHLATYLTRKNIDSLIVTGASTSAACAPRSSTATPTATPCSWWRTAPSTARRSRTS